MIDLHCHLLPGVDDGPASEADAVALARAQVAAGVTRATTTPHVGRNWTTRPEELPRRLADLRHLLAGEGIALDVLGGAEIEAGSAPDMPDELLSALALGGGDRLLVEPPLDPGAIGFERVVEHLHDRGHQVLIAHPERCPALRRDLEALERMIEQGALTQVTAGALTGRFGAATRRFALELVRRGLVDVIASDAHDLSRRPPGLLPDLEATGLERYHGWWCEQVPEAVLGSTAVPPPPAPWPPRTHQRRRGG